jgi:hypothetical protein
MSREGERWREGWIGDRSREGERWGERWVGDRSMVEEAFASPWGSPLANTVTPFEHFWSTFVTLL